MLLLLAVLAGVVTLGRAQVGNPNACIFTAPSGNVYDFTYTTAAPPLNASLDASYTFCVFAAAGESYSAQPAISAGGIEHSAQLLLGSILTALYTETPTGLIVTYASSMPFRDVYVSATVGTATVELVSIYLFDDANAFVDMRSRPCSWS